MSRVRIYELAKEAGMSSKALADKLIAGGYDIKGHSSTVDEETADQIRKTMLQDTKTQLVEKRIDAAAGSPTVIRRRTTIIRRRPKTEESGDDGIAMQEPGVEGDSPDTMEAALSELDSPTDDAAPDTAETGELKSEEVDPESPVETDDASTPETVEALDPGARISRSTARRLCEYIRL